MTPEQKAKRHRDRERWLDRNPEKRAQYKRNYYMSHRARILHIERERSYQKNYGISIADYDAMLVAQGGVCKICGRGRASTNERFRFFAVDHDHKTGAVRGLLCAKCNGVLGWYETHTDGIHAYLAVKS